MKYVKFQNYTFLKIKKYFMKDKNLYLKKPRTLDAWNRQFSPKEGGISCSYTFLGICEAIFRVRDLIFCVEPHISIYFMDIKSSFNLNNLEPAPGRPAYLFLMFLPLILDLDVLEQAPGCPKSKIILYPWNIY